MQEQNYDALQDSMTERLAGLVSTEKVSTLRERVSEKFAELKASGQLDSLTPDEVSLLGDYRLWKTTSASAAGVFHWKKRSGDAPTLAGRPGLRTEAAVANALARSLGQLARAHNLRGCVLLSFTADRIGVNSSGEPDSFGHHMEQLGDRLLAAIDDGRFDPEGGTASKEGEVACVFRIGLTTCGYTQSNHHKHDGGPMNHEFTPGQDVDPAGIMSLTEHDLATAKSADAAPFAPREWRPTSETSPERESR